MCEIIGYCERKSYNIGETFKCWFWWKSYWVDSVYSITWRNLLNLECVLYLSVCIHETLVDLMIEQCGVISYKRYTGNTISVYFLFLKIIHTFYFRCKIETFLWRFSFCILILYSVIVSCLCIFVSHAVTSSSPGNGVWDGMCCHKVK